MCYKGEICGHTFEKQEDGTFLYKAKENPVSLRKKPTKPQYKEKPEYPVVGELEQQAVKRYQEDLVNTAKQIVSFLKEENYVI